jgi:hypothetical protein
MQADVSRIPCVAYFVTPHGYGHAARAAAVMDAVSRRCSDVNFEIFSMVPEWFFRDSVDAEIGYHPLLTDIGLVQHSALEEDVSQTCDQLDAFLPFSEQTIDEAAAVLARCGCSLVVCDIAPLGIAVARAAGIPSVLVENFTWDWIYAEYVRDDARIVSHAAYLREVFAAADHLVQTIPVCLPRAADLTVPPVGRRFRVGREETRRRLGLATDARVVLLTMGGVPWRYAFLDRLAAAEDVCFLIPGAGQMPLPHSLLPANVRLLPAQSGFYHPDLIAASDAVIGKAGYSTVAEVYWAGVPFGYVSRRRFREAPVLENFLRQEVPCVQIFQAEFESGAWLDRLPALLAMPRKNHHGPDGAAVVAEFLLSLLQ